MTLLNDTRTAGPTSDTRPLDRAGVDSGGGRPAAARAAPVTASAAAASSAPAEGTPDLRGLRTVALAHPLSDPELARLRTAEPGLRFLPATADDWHAAVAEADVLLHGWGRDGPLLRIDEVLARAPKLRWIHNAGAGVDGLLTAAVRHSEIVLTNSRGVHAVGIAEHVLALMLAFSRGLPTLLKLQQHSEWAPRPWQGSFELQGQTLAIIGLGQIGSALASRATALGLRVVGVKRRPNAAPLLGGAGTVYGFDLLDTALAEADHVAICLPLTEATRGLFGTERLARLKRGAYVYNIGRGAIVDSAALLEALRSSHVAGAGLDVTEPEPLPADSPLWREPNVIITAHTSGDSAHNTGRVLDLLIDNLRRARRHEPLRNRVDKLEGY